MYFGNTCIKEFFKEFKDLLFKINLQFTYQLILATMACNRL